METDDIFASLGGSLMKDLMADLDDLASSSNLASLESQLDAAVGGGGGGGAPGGGDAGTTGSLGGLPPPPGVGGGGGFGRDLPPPEASGSASAAALVLDHQQQRMAQMGRVPHHDRHPPPPPGVGGMGGVGGGGERPPQQQQQQQGGGTVGAGGGDAWAVSLSQFENSLAAQDFLRADTESKKKIREVDAAPVEADDDMLDMSNLVGSLLEEEEEYDPDEEPVFAGVPAPPPAVPPVSSASSAPSAEVREGGPAAATLGGDVPPRPPPSGPPGGHGGSKAAAAAAAPPAPSPPRAQDPPPRRRQQQQQQQQHQQHQQHQHQHQQHPGVPPGGGHGGNLVPPPPHLMGPPPGGPPPHHMMGPLGPPPMMMTPNGPVPVAMPPPPHVLAAMQQQQHQHLQQQQQQQQQQQHLQQQQLQQQQQPSADGSDQRRRQQGRGRGQGRGGGAAGGGGEDDHSPRKDPMDEASRFRKGDFPTLSSSAAASADRGGGGDGKEGDPNERRGGEEEEEDADAPLIPPRNGGGGGDAAAGSRRQNPKGRGGSGGGRTNQRHQRQQQQQQQQQPTQILQPPRVALAGPNQPPQHQPQHQPRVRVLFNDPRHSAAPVSARSVPSSVMAPRDLTYVVGAMLRALQTADPYADDYYFHALRERRDVGLGGVPHGLFVYGQLGPGAGPAPEPASRATRERAREDELKYRNVVVSRAKDWKEEKQVLGHVVKSDVKRPRALLATTVLRVNQDGAGDDPSSSSSNEQTAEDSTLRRNLWRARTNVDRGYLALIELAELHRLLTLLQHQRQRQLSDPSDARPPPPAAERQRELMREVGENVARLHASLGIRAAAAADGGDDGATAPPAGGTVAGVDLDVLASTLSLPKGREMLARSMERGLLPHPSAEAVLPGALACLFARPRPANVTEGAAAKEDRLLRSLAGIVRLVHPGLSPSTFLSCLEGVIGANRLQDGGRGDGGLKKVLGVKSRAELMHAVLGRGGEVCRAAAAQGGGDGKANGNDICAKWTAAEEEFLRMLSLS